MLQLKNIRKSYDSKVILDSISLDINDGEIVSILGPSGSGKTTLLNAILGLTEIDGGQKQRVALARTLVMKPKILLLDEPLSALDGVIKESIKERIQLIAKQYHLTTIIVTHDPEEALTLSDKVLIINEGQISQFDQPHVIVTQPRTQFVEKFILSQLRIKRDNIFRLFGEPCAFAGVAR